MAFDFTGSCDEPPCRVIWRYFNGGSSLGTAMGEGEHIQFPFDAAGSYSVVVDITNSNSTHGSATATQVVVVGAAPGVEVTPAVLSCMDGARVGRVVTREPTLEDAYVELVSS